MESNKKNFLLGSEVLYNASGQVLLKRRILNITIRYLYRCIIAKVL